MRYYLSKNDNIIIEAEIITTRLGYADIKTKLHPKGFGRTLLDTKVKRNIFINDIEILTNIRKDYIEPLIKVGQPFDIEDVEGLAERWYKIISDKWNLDLIKVESECDL